MKVTGIIRRFDDLGRIVIPKELRRNIFGTQCTDGKPMEFFIDGDSIILKKYEETKNTDAEEQGLIRLPCSIGEPIFVIPSITNYKLNKLNRHEENNRVYKQIVNSITFIKDGYLLNTCDGMCCVRSDSYNETWFLLESQAEAALKKMQEGE